MGAGPLHDGDGCVFPRTYEPTTLSLPGVPLLVSEQVRGHFADHKLQETLRDITNRRECDQLRC